MSFFCIFFCFSSVLICELKFCNVMWSPSKHHCHFRKCAVTTETRDVLSKINYNELNYQLRCYDSESLTLKSAWYTFCHLQRKIGFKIHKIFISENTIWELTAQLIEMCTLLDIIQFDKSWRFQLQLWTNSVEWPIYVHVYMCVYINFTYISFILYFKHQLLIM